MSRETRAPDLGKIPLVVIEEGQPAVLIIPGEDQEKYYDLFIGELYRGKIIMQTEDGVTL